MIELNVLTSSWPLTALSSELIWISVSLEIMPSNFWFSKYWYL